MRFASRVPRPTWSPILARQTVLYVLQPVVSWIDVGDLPGLSGDLQITLPHAVPPTRVEVAHPEHVDAVQWLQVMTCLVPFFSTMVISGLFGQRRLPGSHWVFWATDAISLTTISDPSGMSSTFRNVGTR